MADIHTAAQGCFHVGAVEGIHIHSIVRAGFLRCVDQLAHHLVAVRTAGVLGADGDLLFSALQTVTHAAHVHGNGLRDTCGDGSAAAVAHFFVDGDVGVDLAGGDNLVVCQIFGKAQQNTDTQLVIQETALQITAGSSLGARVKADDIAHFNTQLAGIIGRIYILIQNDLHSVPAAGSGGIILVYMDGSVTKLTGTFNHRAAAGMDADIFRFRVVGIHAAETGQLQAAVALDLTDHGAEGIGMGFQQQGIIGIFTAQIHDHTALAGDGSIKTQRGEGSLHPAGSLFGVARGGINGKQRSGLLPCVVSINSIRHRIVLPLRYSARHRPLPA